jgi:hypothetical protein
VRNGIVLRRLSAVGLAVFAVTCSGERPAADEAEAPDAAAYTPIAQSIAVVKDSSVGCLTLRAPVEAVTSACGEVTDTVIHLEGQPQPAVWVEVQGGRALAEIVRGAVWRIRVTDPSLQTADSIGVGMPASRLADYPGIRISYEEGVTAFVDAHCGKSFSLAGPLPFRREWTADQLRAQPDSVRVDVIMVVGHCDSR